jgi:hypothetical protein
MTVSDEQSPFADVRDEGDGFSIPQLKWRELLFIGALRPEGEGFVREPGRPLPAFAREGLFPEGVLLRAERVGARVLIRRLPEASGTRRV